MEQGQNGAHASHRGLRVSCVNCHDATKMKPLFQFIVLTLAGLIGSPAYAMERVAMSSLNGKLQLAAWWFPAPTTEPRPVVITLHGCNGALNDRQNLNASWIREAGYFNAESMHVLVLDSFTPRGIKSICETPRERRTVSEEDRRDDVFAAIRWLKQQPGVDVTRIAVIGRSHGGQTVLDVADRTADAVKAQPVQPKAFVALYPGCLRATKMWNYELSAPLLLMIGESDDWTPAHYCEQLHGRVTRAQKDAVFELHVFPDSHHGFDGIGPLYTRTNVAGTRSGTATVGGNPEAREKAHRLMFDFLSAQLDVPLRLAHEERFKGHRYVVPQPSGFADIRDVAAVPLGEKGRARYEHYLAQPVPKAFAITEKGGWYLAAADAEAMQSSLSHCRNIKCWLYAVDDRVVWQADAQKRIDQPQLLRKP
ncbi:hypothetical protein EGT07_01685 [Herbaspirillum sp. HC18]|nr:hypothetical protein EGT07_01685 [Herbaspirillum sp. HC18]